MPLVGAAATAVGAIVFFFAIVGVFGLKIAIGALLVFIVLSIASARLPQY
jgi:heme/copper-type cytochrome/quinol oxidase subunit 3